MAKFTATVQWQRNEDDFLAQHYSRAHSWTFDGGVSVPASASPHIVPPPWSKEENVDPEEAFVASLSSCHMLFFLSVAAENGFQLDSYTDTASGRMGKNEQGKFLITQVDLNPCCEFSGKAIPNAEKIAELHHQAHEQCFIANSVITKININPG